MDPLNKMSPHIVCSRKFKKQCKTEFWPQNFTVTGLVFEQKTMRKNRWNHANCL